MYLVESKKIMSHSPEEASVGVASVDRVLQLLAALLGRRGLLADEGKLLLHLARRDAALGEHLRLGSMNESPKHYAV